MSHDRGVSRANREFVEKVLSGHDRVECFTGDGDRQFTVTRTRGDTLNVRLTGMYTFGIIDFFELRQAFPLVDCIVTASPYLSYTGDAKEEAVRAGIGLFTMKEFLGALNYERFWEYVPKS